MSIFRNKKRVFIQHHMLNNLTIILKKLLRPSSSRILSKGISCNATNVVSNMSNPSWFENIKNGNEGTFKRNKLHLVTSKLGKVYSSMQYYKDD